MPHSRSVLRCPGIRLSKLQNTSLPKQEKSVLSMDSTPGSREATSGTVPPRPFAYCVLTSAGIFRIPAARMSSCEFRTSCSFSKIGGSNFCWMSITTSAQRSASIDCRAISAYSELVERCSRLVFMYSSYHLDIRSSWTEPFSRPRTIGQSQDACVHSNVRAHRGASHAQVDRDSL